MAGIGRNKADAETIKKQLALRYPYNYNQQLSSLMGAYATYQVNGKEYKALATFNKILSYIQNDLRYRMFQKSKDPEDLDYEKMVEFDELCLEFRIMYGSEPLRKDPRTGEEEKRPLSFLDLRVVKVPEAGEDRVFISRKIPIVYTWGNYPAAEVAFKIGFHYKVTEYIKTPSGMEFPLEKKVPMFDWSDPSMPYFMSNCVPWVYYSANKNECRNRLYKIVDMLEAMIAAYLHNERYSYMAMLEGAGGNGRAGGATGGAAPDESAVQSIMNDDFEAEDSGVALFGEDDKYNE